MSEKFEGGSIKIEGQQNKEQIEASFNEVVNLIYSEKEKGLNTKQEEIRAAQVKYTKQLENTEYFKRADEIEKDILRTGIEDYVYWSLYRGDSRMVSIPAQRMMDLYGMKASRKELKHVYATAKAILEKDLEKFNEDDYHKEGEDGFEAERAHQNAMEGEAEIMENQDYLDLSYFDSLSNIATKEDGEEIAVYLSKRGDGFSNSQFPRAKWDLALGKLFKRAGDEDRARVYFESCIARMNRDKDFQLSSNPDYRAGAGFSDEAGTNLREVWKASDDYIKNFEEVIDSRTCRDEAALAAVELLRINVPAEQEKYLWEILNKYLAKKKLPNFDSSGYNKGSVLMALSNYYLDRNYKSKALKELKTAITEFDKDNTLDPNFPYWRTFSQSMVQQSIMDAKAQKGKIDDSYDLSEAKNYYRSMVENAGPAYRAKYRMKLRDIEVDNTQR